MKSDIDGFLVGLLQYVDDIILKENHEKSIQAIMSQLSTKFDTKDLGC